jgi:phosphate:Na+ symporter
MQLTDVLGLFGGLALFLYGMKMMSQGLEAAAGNRMKSILEKLTSNRFVGVAVGAIITAIIQSSSATTVMVVGFVNSNLMTLNQAVWVIMGANIGTTITGQLIALKVGVIAPIFALAGVIMVSFCKKQKVIHLGDVIAGLGILFIGMDMMSGAMVPLRDNPDFVQLMTKFSNPFLGILFGAVFTAIIQSSSASVGILQALAMSGVIGLESSVFILFGQNIGTCITAVLASLGANRNAKRTTIIHLSFNIIGTCIFVVLAMVTPLVSWMQSITDNPAAQIANMHTLFNIVTTLLLLPIGQQLAVLSQKILPVLPNESTEMKLLFMGEGAIGSTTIAITQLSKEVGRMFGFAKENLRLSIDAVLNSSTAEMEKINQNEEYLDYLNAEIAQYMAKISSVDMQYSDSEVTTALFKMTNDLERIGDHCTNLVEYVAAMDEKERSFSKNALDELQQMGDTLNRMMDTLEKSTMKNLEDTYKATVEGEQRIDDLCAQFRANQIKRLKKGKCNASSCVMYSEMLTDMERISDHMMNLAEASYRNHFTLIYS